MPAPFVRAVTHHLPSLRSLTVARVARITPVFARVTLSGPDLDDFPATAPDDPVTVYFPAPAAETAPALAATPAQNPAAGPVAGLRGVGLGHPEPTAAFARSVTPRAYRPSGGGHPAELDLDLVLHGDGLASSWARTATAGDRLVIGCPDTTTALPDGARSVLLLGDETALPTIARWLEVLPEHVSIAGLIELRDERASGYLPDELRMRADILWLQRAHGDGLLAAAVRALGPLDDTTYVFGAGEAEAIGALRRQLRHEQGASTEQLALSAYWREGESAG
jgi:NADPH-dependent ferric siderophore reductase